MENPYRPSLAPTGVKASKRQKGSSRRRRSSRYAVKRGTWNGMERWNGIWNGFGMEWNDGMEYGMDLYRTKAQTTDLLLLRK